MKKKLKTIGIVVLTGLLLLAGNMNFQASATTIDVAGDVNDISDDGRVLLDSKTFYMTADGKEYEISEWNMSDSNMALSLTRASTGITYNFSYYYLGKNSNKQPEYQVVLSITSNTKLKSSVLSTKAEGVTSWNNHTAYHSGKTGTNTRTYLYTSSNPPSNPYCYVKATITTSDGSSYSTSTGKLTDPTSK